MSPDTVEAIECQVCQVTVICRNGKEILKSLLERQKYLCKLSIAVGPWEG
jgi:hypothetical protein